MEFGVANWKQVELCGIFNHMAKRHAFEIDLPLSCNFISFNSDEERCATYAPCIY